MGSERTARAGKHIGRDEGKGGARLGFAELRSRLSLQAVADGEGLKPRAWARGGLVFDCPSCRRGARDGSGARSRDALTWGCVRCEAKGDVVDVLALSRGISPSEARRDALRLIGEDEPDARPLKTPKRHPGPEKPSPSALSGDDLAERLRAVRFAALHYNRFAELGSADDLETVSASEQADFCGVRLDAEALAAAQGYLRERLGKALPAIRPVAHELIGVCPGPNTGLARFLEIHGGRRGELVEAARRADLIGPDGRERFASGLVYFWHDLAGSVAYLTGRTRTTKLCPRAPHNNEDGRGLPLPEVPFGGYLADRGEWEDPTIWLVEGELDAVMGLGVGPTVATGGAGRMGGARGVEALRRWLRGRPAVVRFDAEPDPEKAAKIDERARKLAEALDCQWLDHGGPR